MESSSDFIYWCGVDGWWISWELGMSSFSFSFSLLLFLLLVPSLLPNPYDVNRLVP